MRAADADIMSSFRHLDFKSVFKILGYNILVLSKRM